MFSLLNTIEDTLTTFFSQFTDALGFAGYLGLVLGVEAFFVLLFMLKSAFSYEARLKRSLDKCNRWLFRFKKIDQNNIKDFNKIIKKGPKRFVYYWQQFILYRDGGPSAYLSEENVIEKPLKTSSWASNIKNLGLLTAVWSVFAFIFGISSQRALGTITPDSIVIALVLPCLSALLGVVAIIILKGRRVMNLDDIYHIYHLFSRFLTNATVDLTPYIDFNLLFTQKEIENGNPQLREFYENRARKIREEFEEAQKNDVPLQTYEFENVGVDGSLLLNRAMNESELYINKKNEILSKIAQIESQKEALKRNFEDVQMNLQRQIQASKENIQKLIEQQAATTNRIEAGSLKNQQQKEVNRNNQLQKDYEQEENRYLRSKAELDAELDKLKNSLDEGVTEVQKAMSNEYQTFFEKVMKSAYQVAEQRIKEEKLALTNERDKNEEELVSVQTQIKRLKDENDTLRDRLSKYDPNYQREQSNDEKGYYDENGNYIYSDGSYHDTNGLFHDVDGKVYNMNGELVSYDLTPEEELAQQKEEIKNEQVNSFGAYLDDQNQTVVPSESNEDSQTNIDDAMNEIAKQMGEVHVENNDKQDESANQEPQEEDSQPQEENVETERNTTDTQEENQTPQEQNNDGQDDDSLILIDESMTDGMVTNDQSKTGEKPEEKGQQEKEIVENVDDTTQSDIGEDKQVEDSDENKQVINANDSDAETNSIVQDSKQDEQEKPPAKKRGRPRKNTVEESVKQPKKRGRPRKVETTEDTIAKTPKKRGRPAKSQSQKSTKPTTTKSTTNKKPAKKTTSAGRKTTKKPATTQPTQTAKKRGRPKKATTNNATETLVVANQPKKRGRPKKETMDSSFVNKLNELISQQENKLKNLKEFLNNEIDQVLEPEEQETINHEQDDIINSVEALKQQADKAKSSGQSDELAKINKRIEDLIKDLSNINSNDDADAQ